MTKKVYCVVCGTEITDRDYDEFSGLCENCQEIADEEGLSNVDDEGNFIE